MSLVAQADNYKNFIEEHITLLWFKEFLQNNESFDIVWSIKYWIAVEWESDIDIRITSPNPRESFVKKTQILIEKMATNKYFKKMVVNNFYDSFEEFDRNKEKLLWQKKEGSENFMIELTYFLDNKLDKHIKFEFHISDIPFIEKFPELLTLNDTDKEILIWLKKYVYNTFPFFRNRSYLIYTWFLQWYKTEDSLKLYLNEQWFNRLVKK